MIRLGRWQYIKRIGWEPKHISSLDHILDDFEFIWFLSNKPKFFRHKTMRQLRYTRADRAVRLNRNLRIRETEEGK